MISLLNLNLGNIKSLSNCLLYLGIKHNVVEKPEEIKKSKFLIIPGVGSFDYAIKVIKKKKLKESIITHATIKNKPILGICIGMQILFSSSEEGRESGLGIFSEKLFKLKKNDEYKVPNVGFGEIFNFENKGIFKNMNNDYSFYFTNSFGLKYSKKNNFDNLCITKHKFNYIAAFQKNNIVGLQFHPELSHSSGMVMLKNIYTELL